MRQRLALKEAITYSSAQAGRPNTAGDCPGILAKALIGVTETVQDSSFAPQVTQRPADTERLLARRHRRLVVANVDSAPADGIERRCHLDLGASCPGQVECLLGVTECLKVTMLALEGVRDIEAASGDGDLVTEPLEEVCGLAQVS